MAKFAVLFFAAMAFHATLATPVGESWVPELKKRVTETSNAAVTLIENAQIDSTQAKRSLRSQANEWAREIETATFLLQRAINRNQAEEGQEPLKQVVVRLDNIAHSLRLVLNAEPSELKDKLKALIPDATAEADKLIEIFRQQLQKEKQNKDNVSEDLEDVLEEILTATRQLKQRRNILTLNQQQIKDAIKKAGSDVVTAIDGISSKNQKAARELSHQAHEFNHDLSRIIHQLRREAHRLDDEARITILQVSNKLSEIRAAVDHAANGQGKEAEAWITELKNQVKSNVQNIEPQLDKLVDLLRTGNESSQDAQDINNLIRSVLASSLTGAHIRKLSLESIDEASN